MTYIYIRRFGNMIHNEEYFEAKDKKFYQKDIEILERRWNECIPLEGDYADKRSRI